MWSDSLGNGMNLQVNQAIGNAYLNYPLDSLQTPVGPLVLSVTYNSQLPDDLGMGPGWNVSAGPLSDAKLPTKLVKLDSHHGGGVSITFADSSIAHYAKLAGNTYSGEGSDGGTVFCNTPDGQTACPPTTSVGDAFAQWTYVSDSGSKY